MLPETGNKEMVVYLSGRNIQVTSPTPDCWDQII